MLCFLMLEATSGSFPVLHCRLIHYSTLPQGAEAKPPPAGRCSASRLPGEKSIKSVPQALSVSESEPWLFMRLIEVLAPSLSFCYDVTNRLQADKKKKKRRMHELKSLNFRMSVTVKAKNSQFLRAHGLALDRWNKLCDSVREILCVL